MKMVQLESDCHTLKLWIFFWEQGEYEWPLHIHVHPGKPINKICRCIIPYANKLQATFLEFQTHLIQSEHKPWDHYNKNSMEIHVSLSVHVHCFMHHPH